LVVLGHQWDVAVEHARKLTNWADLPFGDAYQTIEVANRTFQAAFNAAAEAGEGRARTPTGEHTLDWDLDAQLHQWAEYTDRAWAVHRAKIVGTQADDGYVPPEATTASHPVSPPAREASAAAARPGRRRKDITAHILATCAENPEAVQWSAMRWAKTLGCAKSSVIESTAWRQIQTARALVRAGAVENRRGSG
jgi:hypothetical protein